MNWSTGDLGELGDSITDGVCVVALAHFASEVTDASNHITWGVNDGLRDR